MPGTQQTADRAARRSRTAWWRRSALLVATLVVGTSAIAVSTAGSASAASPTTALLGNTSVPRIPRAGIAASSLCSTGSFMVGARIWVDTFPRVTGYAALCSSGIGAPTLGAVVGSTDTIGTADAVAVGDSLCNGTDLAVGLEAANGEVINALGVRCAGVGGTYDAPVIGNQTTIKSDANCDSGTALTGIQGWYNIYGGPHDNVYGVQGTCATPGPSLVPTFGPVSVGNDEVTLHWTPGAYNGSLLTGYTLTYQPIGGGPITIVTPAPSATDTAATVFGLTNGATYTFTLVENNGLGSSNPASVVGTPATTPGAPTHVAAVPDNGQAKITWDTPGDTGGAPITGYIVSYSGNGGGTWTGLSLVPGQALTTSGLPNGTCVFEVQAVNVNGPGAASAPSAPVTIAPAGPSATVPGAPTDVMATAGDGQAVVSWTAPASDGGAIITGYQLQYSADGGTTWTSDVVNPIAGARATVTGLTNGTSYIFRVAAINSVGTGAFSAPSTPVVAKPGGTPAVPDTTSLTIRVVKSHVRKGDHDTISTILTDTAAGKVLAGRRVQLQVLGANGKWHTIVVKKTGPKGRALDTMNLTTTHTYRWHFVGTATGAGATSKTAKVTVSKK